MARILYGVHGTGHGHAMRALTIARRLRSHDFLFVAADDAPGVLEGEFPVRRIPNLGTVFKNYKVDMAATIGRAVPLLLRSGHHTRSVLRIIEEFKPDVCMTDLEFFVPRAARQAGSSAPSVQSTMLETTMNTTSPVTMCAGSSLK